ncbi:MAG: hypothetical protein ABH840_02960 [Nanoarchaeota archaeon]
MLDLNCLGESFMREAYSDERFREALGIVSANSRGKIWLIGGFLYKTLIKIMHETEITCKDFDFIVERGRRLDLPEGWKSRTNRFGNPELRSENNCVDFIPLDNLLYLRGKRMEPNITNYLASVNFSVFALAYDLREEKIIDGGAIAALEMKVVGVHNPEAAKFSAGVYNKTINEMLRTRAVELGFRAEFVSD